MTITEHVGASTVTTQKDLRTKYKASISANADRIIPLHIAGHHKDMRIAALESTVYALTTLLLTDGWSDAGVGQMYANAASFALLASEFQAAHDIAQCGLAIGVADAEDTARLHGVIKKAVKYGQTLLVVDDA